MRQQSAPNVIGQKSPEFVKENFDAAIWNKGYDVIVEKAIRCPCKTRTGANLPDCNNCRGFGWVFVNPIETKALMTSLNASNKYKAWSVENINRANVTLMGVNRLSYFDRITLKDDYSELSENLEVKKSSTGKMFVFTSYKITNIFIIFEFENSTMPLVKISSNDYIVEDYKVVFKDGIIDCGKIVSIRYEYNTQYNVLDVTHDIRSSKNINSDGNLENIKLPIMAVVQKPHTIFDKPNFTGDNIIDNSWK